jgi:hypothetical protein
MIIIIIIRIQFGYGSSQEGHRPQPPACGAGGKGANKGRRDGGEETGKHTEQTRNLIVTN